MHRRPQSFARLAVATAALGILFALPALSQPTTVQNDSYTDTGLIQAGFVADEGAASWLTSPCNGDLEKIQVLWLSQFGGAPQSLEQAVRVYDDGIFPVPGSILTELPGPLMTDGFINEFTLAPAIPVITGQTFVAEFQFLNSPGVFGPSVVTDVDGCQSGKNAIFAIPPGAWIDSCLLGVSGDFVIRAVVNCAAAPPDIFADGFESGDTSAWSAVVP